MDNVFCFWEGPMPEYVELCMRTWNFPYILLNYHNINDYVKIDIKKAKRFTLPQISDIVRAHVLKKYGGYWLDCDSIVLGQLPNVNIMGDPITREISIGYLQTAAHTDMYEKWVDYQDKVYLKDEMPPLNWALMGNAFLDGYVKDNLDITIGNRELCFPEIYMIDIDDDRWGKYQQFYFKSSYHISDIRDTKLILLHNSWTPDWYKNLSISEILAQNCTMSNFIKERI